MMSRSRSVPWLVAAVLALPSARSLAQDAPLYRDPSPTEGPRIMGPLLPARPSVPGSMPPPPSNLGPFQPSTPSPDSPGVATAAPASEGLESLREPLLAIPPMPPPLPALPIPPMSSGDVVEVKRTTKIRGPNGVLGRFHDWFRDAIYGPTRPPAASTVPRRSFFGGFRPTTPPSDGSNRLINWPTWPAWPLGGASR
jgi:hypothetical protein